MLRSLRNRGGRLRIILSSSICRAALAQPCRTTKRGGSRRISPSCPTYYGRLDRDNVDY